MTTGGNRSEALKVLSAGVGRSGSTWLFHALLALLGQKYATYGAWVTAWDSAKADAAEALILKVHSQWQIGDFSYDLSATCHRDLRDVALSLRDYQKLTTDEEILTGVAWARSCHDEFSPTADADISYDRMMSEPLVVLAELAQLLGIENPDLDAARHVVEGWEPTGHAHRFDGRSGRWRTQLSSTLQQAIEERHGDWLRRLGYPI